MTDTPTTDDSLEHRLLLRNLVLGDYPDIAYVQDRVYKSTGGAISEKKFRNQLIAFPEGQICIEDDGKVVAAAFALIVDYDKFGNHHTYDEITGNAYLSTHDPKGDVLYGVDIYVDPDYRQLRLGRRLYEARKEICRNLNLKAMVAGGRIPHYANYAKEMRPQEYIEKVKKSRYTIRP